MENIIDSGFEGDKQCPQCGAAMMQEEDFETGKSVYKCTGCEYKEEVEYEEI